MPLFVSMYWDIVTEFAVNISSLGGMLFLTDWEFNLAATLEGCR